MKLNLVERLALKEQLNDVEVGKIGFLRDVEDLQKRCLIQPEEFEEYGIVEGKKTPLKPGSAQVEKEIEVSPEIFNKVKELLTKNEKEGTFRKIYLCLWEKFTNGDGQDKG